MCKLTSYTALMPGLVIQIKYKDLIYEAVLKKVMQHAYDLQSYLYGISIKGPVQGQIFCFFDFQLCNCYKDVKYHRPRH